MCSWANSGHDYVIALIAKEILYIFSYFLMKKLLKYIQCFSHLGSKNYKFTSNKSTHQRLANNTKNPPNVPKVLV